MLLERYTYEVNPSFLQYDFYSEGPRGKIRKMVAYTFLGSLEGVDYYNLGFGDLDEKEGRIDDLSVTGNEDRDKVLATVAYTVLEFTNHFPGCMIIVEGSTRSRTRLYQMGIAKNYAEIDQIFDIQGLTGMANWVPFKGGENYLALLIGRK